MKAYALFAATALLAVTTSAAYADSTVTQTGTIATTVTDFSNVDFSDIGGVANDTTFLGFNSALGTLTSVTVDFTLTGDETGTLTNSATNAQTFKFESNSNASLGGTNVPAALANDALATAGLTLTEALTSYTLGAAGSGSNTTSILPTPNAFGTGIVTGSDTFTGAAADEFIGQNFTLNMSTLSGSTFLGGGGNLSAQLATKDGATFEITYTYTPTSTVPEPASIALLGAGLLGMTFFVRRRYSL